MNNLGHPLCIDEKLFRVAVVDFTEPHAAKKFTDSLKNTGFAVLTGHPVPNELIQRVYAEWRDFMNHLHQAYEAGEDGNAALKYFRDLNTQHGYFPMAASEKAKNAKVKDIKHYFQLYFPHGQYPSEVSDDARKLWGELFDLGKTLVGWIDEHMPPEIKATIQKKIGKDRTLADCVSGDKTMLRVLHYPGYLDSEGEAGAVRAAAHEDINLITVLPAGSARGLQVKSNQSGDWYEVPLVEGSIVINVGDMMQEMSEHAYISTTHRVIKMDDGNVNDDGVAAVAEDGRAQFLSGDRMSTPCFIHLKENCPLSSRYGSAQHYLIERLVALGVVPPNALDRMLEQYPGGVMSGWENDVCE
jgi:isopenicillin N synthase-like dioxygenase